MVMKQNWDNNAKLPKLMEALEDMALTFFNSCPENICNNYQLKAKKCNS